MNFDRYSKWTKRELMVGIAFSYFFRTFTTKVFDIILSLLTMVGIPVLFCGSFPIVWGISLIIHSVYVLFFLEKIRSRFGTDESYNEWTSEIRAMKWWLMSK